MILFFFIFIFYICCCLGRGGGSQTTLLLDSLLPVAAHFSHLCFDAFSAAPYRGVAPEEGVVGVSTSAEIWPVCPEWSQHNAWTVMLTVDSPNNFNCSLLFFAFILL